MSNQAIATDIYDFAELLVSHNVIQDAKSLYEASGKLLNSQNPNAWAYKCGSLKFSVEGAFGGSIPNSLSLTEIFFNVTVEGLFQNTANLFVNPLVDLSFEIELVGYREFQNKFEEYFASWHLDKHESGGNSPTYVHPEYHFTFGGKRLEEKGEIFGSTLILPSPRIAYPPMDVILGIDFILQNYFPLDKISDLLNDSRYKEIVSNSQERLWKPYYLSISSNWNILPTISFAKGFHHLDLNPHINQ